MYLGNGDGTFQAANTFAISPAESNPNFVAVGDFNGDGALDLAVTNYNSNTLSILLGNGDGTFRAAQREAFALAVGEFNGDGIPDLAVAGASANTVSIFRWRPRRPSLGPF